MSVRTIFEIVEGLEIFADLTKEEICEVAKRFSVVHMQEGAILFEENAMRRRLFVIESGEVELFKRVGFGKEKRLVCFGKGDFLGEGCLLDEYPHSTCARTTMDSVIWTMERESFVQMGKEFPQIAIQVLARIARIISRRMNHANTRMSSSTAQYFSGKTRMEHDLLGERAVPDECYYGIQTMRGLENFYISGVPISHFPKLIEALAMVKMACARANSVLGHMDKKLAGYIEAACLEILNGKYHSQFVVDMIQGGAGTSTNMNANEVIANRALVLMGKDKGQYEYCHPNNHVNLSQSTNDAYPTALKLAFLNFNKDFLESLRNLIHSFQTKGKEFSHVIKMGRTQLQDAVPMTLGQEFDAWANTLHVDIKRIQDAASLFKAINMGGTAIGTGINTSPKYRETVTRALCEISGWDLVSAENLVENTQDMGGFVMYSSALKGLAVKLSRICNDLRLLSSGPRAGLNEINLPKMQPGSSIMPGKVNPVIPEVVNQIAFKVIGNDLAVTLASEAGQLELNVMEPVIAQSILESMEMMINGMNTLRVLCIDGITANEEICRGYVQKSIGIVTALNPVLGYEACSRLAKKALETGNGLYELVLEEGLLSQAKLDELLAPENMIAPKEL